MWFGIVSLFPEMFAAITEQGITGRAVKNGITEVNFWNPRDFTKDVHRTVDDRPFGGGPGMVMKVEPLALALQAAKKAAPEGAKTIYLSPQGKKMEQKALQQLLAYPSLILLCGRYEGIDERIIETEVDEEWSLGDFVLSGGELAAMAMMDALIRLLPGALNTRQSAIEDSFSDQHGLLDCPHFTRPVEFAGLTVPEVLRSGDHKKIARWRLKQQLGRTWLRRPEILGNVQLSPEEKELMAEFKRENPRL